MATCHGNHHLVFRFILLSFFYVSLLADRSLSKVNKLYTAIDMFLFFVCFSRVSYDCMEWVVYRFIVAQSMRGKRQREGINEQTIEFEIASELNAHHVIFGLNSGPISTHNKVFKKRKPRVLI